MNKLFKEEEERWGSSIQQSCSYSWSGYQIKRKSLYKQQQTIISLKIWGLLGRYGYTKIFEKDLILSNALIFLTFFFLSSKLSPHPPILFMINLFIFTEVSTSAQSHSQESHSDKHSIFSLAEVSSSWVSVQCSAKKKENLFKNLENLKEKLIS